MSTKKKKAKKVAVAFMAAILTELLLVISIILCSIQLQEIYTSKPLGAKSHCKGAEIVGGVVDEADLSCILRDSDNLEIRNNRLSYAIPALIAIVASLLANSYLLYHLKNKSKSPI